MNSRQNYIEEHISDLEDIILEITQTEQHTERQILKISSATYKISGITSKLPTFTI